MTRKAILLILFLASMAGLATVQPGALLLGGIVYQPYYLVTFAVAAAVTWTAPQTADWLRRPTWGKAVAALVLLWLALIAMETQGYNPFIYFIF